jgi:hypothetical protein
VGVIDGYRDDASDRVEEEEREKEEEGAAAGLTSVRGIAVVAASVQMELDTGQRAHAHTQQTK